MSISLARARLRLGLRFGHSNKRTTFTTMKKYHKIFRLVYQIIWVNEMLDFSANTKTETQILCTLIKTSICRNESLPALHQSKYCFRNFQQLGQISAKSFSQWCCQIFFQHLRWFYHFIGGTKGGLISVSFSLWVIQGQLQE